MAPIKDIVVDNDVMVRLWADEYIEFRDWLSRIGVLTTSKRLIREYTGSNNQHVMVFIGFMIREGRLSKLSDESLKSFTDDRHYGYTCNVADRCHAKVVFLSCRKLLVSLDKRFCRDVCGFKKVDGIKPKATGVPEKDFYK